GRRGVSDVVDEITLRVKAVLPAESLGSRFSLSPSLATPRNVFLPLRLLQARLGQEGRVHGPLAAPKAPASRGWRDHLEDWWSGVSPWEPSLQVQLGQRLNLEDWGLVLRDPDSRTHDLFARLDRNRDGRLTPNEWRRQLAEAFVRAADKNGD